MVRLVVAEKPSVARDIARILGATQRGDGCLRGSGLWVTWCVGHVAELAEPEAYNGAWKRWSASTLPMLPARFTLRPSRHAYDQFKHIKTLMRDGQVREVVNACDAGREGELIFRFAYELAGCTQPVRRLWLSAMTDNAVREAFRHLAQGADFDALGDAARCRAEADWLVGLNATRALTLRQRAVGSQSSDAAAAGGSSKQPASGKGVGWRKDGPKPPLYSVGRVQTPTLAMLVRREAEIRAFVADPFWQVLATFGGAREAYDGLYHTRPPQGTGSLRAAPAASATRGVAEPPGSAERASGNDGRVGEWPGRDGRGGGAAGAPGRDEPDRLYRRADAEAVLRDVQGRPAEIAAVDRREVSEAPPLLFDLTGLQRRANVRHHLSAAQTLEAAQSLYERHKLLTYPRTDSNHLTGEVAQTLPQVLRGLNTPPFSDKVQPLLASGPLKLGARIVNDAEAGDHHAIIPTGKTPNLAALSAAERQVFELVANRFIAAFYPPARFALTRIDTHVQGASGAQHLFISRGRVCLDEGWQAVEPPFGAARAGDKAPPLLPNVQRGEPVQADKARLREGETKPPPRFNDALLLGAMERAGSQCETAELRLAMKDGGLGTPATRASIIEVLQRRGYARRDGKLLVPTQQGEELIAALPVADLKSPELTGVWEARLAKVAKGALSREAFMAEVNTLTTNVVRAILGDAFGALPTADANVAPRAAKKPRKRAAHKAGPKLGSRKDVQASAAQVTPSKRTEAAAAAQPNARKRRTPHDLPTCPLCKTHAIIRGRAAWGCGGWREGCKFTLSYAPLGYALKDSQFRTLIEKGHTLALDVEGKRAKIELDLGVAERFRRVPMAARTAKGRGKKKPAG